MLYELCSDLAIYAQAIGLAWFGIVSLSVPFVVNEALGRSERYREWASKLAHPTLRRIVLFGLLLGSVFLAGFLAWRDEHQARVRADDQLRTQIERLPDYARSRIELTMTTWTKNHPPKNTPDLLIDYSNKGLGSATDPLVLAQHRLSEAPLSAEETDKWMVSAYSKLPSEYRGIDRNAFEPDKGQGFYGGISLSEQQLLDIGARKLYLYVGIFFVYADASEPNNSVRLTEYCITTVGYLFNGPKCQNHNRTVRWPINRP